jgi:hypothetical protein
MLAIEMDTTNHTLTPDTIILLNPHLPMTTLALEMQLMAHGAYMQTYACSISAIHQFHNLSTMDMIEVLGLPALACFPLRSPNLCDNIFTVV